MVDQKIWQKDSGPANPIRDSRFPAALLRNVRAAFRIITTTANLPILLEVADGLFTRVSTLTIPWHLPYPL
jgi:hypothetical protein